jgi:hypothetical protein
MKRLEKFKELEEILGTERVLTDLVLALSESQAQELAEYIAKNYDIEA